MLSVSNYVNCEQVTYDGCLPHLRLKQRGKRYFFATHQMNNPSLEVFGTPPRFHGPEAPHSGAGTGHLASPPRGLGPARPAPALLHCGEVPELSKTQLGFFWDVKMIAYIQLAGHCQAGEGNNFGILASGGGSEPPLPQNPHSFITEII